MKPNRVQAIRESLVMSKSELARKAEISPLTVDRIEKGAPCRMATMRKIILALGLTLADREQVFPE
jgi:DNA-binding XRE family transcriptional regulator